MAEKKANRAAEDAQANEAAAETQASHTAMAGDRVELKDKESIFHDVVTGFEIQLDEQKELTKPVGEMTATALVTGRLLYVR